MSKNKTEMTKLEESTIKREEALKAYESAIVSGVKADILLAEASLKEAEKKHAHEIEADLYEKLAKEEKPMLAAILMRTYEIPAHHDVYVENALTGVESTTKEVQINLLKFCEKAKLDKKWYYLAENLNLLMCIATAKELGYTKAELDKIKTQYARRAESQKLNETVSNNNIEKALQSVIDEMIFEPNDKGENIYKVFNQDVKYMRMVYTKKGKGLTVNTSGHRDFTMTIANIAHRIVTGTARYEVGFKMSKEAREALTK